MSCRQPEFSCYCAHVQKIPVNFKIVILIHPLEARRRIATGRMSHLCLDNSHLIRGQDFSADEQVNKILADPKLYPVILYPGKNSLNLTSLMPNDRAMICPQGKTLCIFVIDGTWATAKKMLRQSQNLQNIPRICFSPSTPSNFRVRKQPKEGCYSTIEAIHHCIELLGSSQGFDTSSRKHDQLLTVFNAMVELQLDFIKKSSGKPGSHRYIRRRD